MPPSFTKSRGLRSRGLADAHNDQTRHVEAGGRHQVERRSVLALEPVGCRRPRDQIAGGLERFARGGAEFQPLLAEQDENALAGVENGAKPSFRTPDMGADSS